MEVLLRPWRLSDAENLAQLANNPNIAKNLRDAFPHPYTMEHAVQFITMVHSKLPQTIFAIEYGGNLVGGIGLHSQNDIYKSNAELGYWIAEAYWGKGIVVEAIKKILPIGFSLPNIERIFAVPFGSNIGSQRVLEKTGFTLEAKLSKTLIKNGVYEDELIYAIRKA